MATVTPAQSRTYQAPGEAAERTISRRFPWRMAVRRALSALAVAAIIGAIVWAFRPVPVPVDVVAVARGPLVVTLDEDGETRVRDRFVVTAPLAGRLLRTELEAGAPVEANRTVLARFLPAAPALLDTRTRTELAARARAAEAAVSQARAEVSRVVAQLEQAERTLTRSRNLARAGALAPEALEEAELGVRTLREAKTAADAAVRAAEWEERLARASLMPPDAGRGDQRAQTIVLRSPIDGVVLKRWHESEAVVPLGEPLVEVGDVSKLEIVADFLSTDAVTIRPGHDVVVERWGGGAPLRGRVRRVEPSGFTKVSALGVEEQRVNVIVDLADPRDAWLKLGDRYRVEVRVVVWQKDAVTKVPTGSLARQGEAWSVFVVEEGRAVRRLVRVGARNDLEAEVLSGVSTGERVIVFPSDAVDDGVLVDERGA